MSKRSSNGRSPLVNQQSQITTFFAKMSASKPCTSASTACTPASPSCTSSPSPLSVTSKLNPKPKLNPSPLQGKPKKPLLVIDSPVQDGAKKSYGEEVVEKRVRVFWPLDKVWYEGFVKLFDKVSGKHLVQYDDAEEEMLSLSEEKIEWVEGEVKKFKRLRRVSVVDDEEEMEGGGDGDGDGGDDSEDEDWGKNVEKELFEDGEDGLEDMDLVDEEDGDDEEVGKSKRNIDRKAESKKRKASEVGKLECNRKSKNGDGLKNSGLKGKFLESPAAIVDCKGT